MALVIEDGSQVTGAVSYVTEAELTAYALSIGETLVVDESELLMRAALYVETLQFIGSKLTKAQRMQWPRSGVVLDGFEIATNEIPQILKDLQINTALSINNGLDPLAVKTRDVKSESVGSLSTTYMDGSEAPTVTPMMRLLANKLIGRSSGGISVNLYRT